MLRQLGSVDKAKNKKDPAVEMAVSFRMVVDLYYVPSDLILTYSKPCLFVLQFSVLAK